jgi:hypothetical protein
MRTITLITFSVLMVILVATGCTKDERQSPVANPNAQASVKITKQLLAFRNNLKLKNGSSLPVDSATWYLEGLLNLENANNTHEFHGLTFFKDTIVLFTSGSEITLSELNEAYSFLTNKLNVVAQSQTIPDFAYNAIDISIISNGYKNGETLIVMDFGGGSRTVGNYTAFGETDYWVWGMEFGKCGAYSGQGGFSDAAKELNYKFNHPVALPEPGYYTDIVDTVAKGYEFPDTLNPGPYCEYKIFWFDASFYYSQPCISPNELNYYLSTMPFIIDAKRPNNMSYIDVYVTSVYILTTPTIYWHSYTLHYGIFHQYD